LICAKPAVVIFLIYVVWVSFTPALHSGLIALLLTVFGDWLERPLRSKTDRPLALAHMQVSALILAATFGSMLTPYGPKLDMYSASLASSMKL
jgi:predicted PurR-regulated permease PerM